MSLCESAGQEGHEQSVWLANIALVVVADPALSFRTVFRGPIFSSDDVLISVLVLEPVLLPRLKSSSDPWRN